MYFNAPRPHETPRPDQQRQQGMGGGPSHGPNAGMAPGQQHGMNGGPMNSPAGGHMGGGAPSMMWGGRMPAFPQGWQPGQEWQGYNPQQYTGSLFGAPGGMGQPMQPQVMPPQQPYVMPQMQAPPQYGQPSPGYGWSGMGGMNRPAQKPQIGGPLPPTSI